jgi:integrase
MENEINETKNIDYANIMNNKEAYYSEIQVQKILDYYYDKKEFGKMMLFMVLYRTGRRISEIVGMPQNYQANDRQRTQTPYKGLRPIDIKHKQRLIEFDILKKNHVSGKNKQGQPKVKDVIVRAKMRKKPKRVLKPVDDELYNNLIWYIEHAKIQPNERIFPISRFTADIWLKEAIKKTGIIMNLGTKKVKIRGSSEIRTVQVKPHLHMFRHSFAIHILKRNPKDPTALPKLKNLLEHSRMDITEHYLQFNQEDNKDFLNKTWKSED